MVDEHRLEEHGWTSRRAFILGAVASAIGLGNVWRFPYICYKYGGGAFILVYILALLTVGIPIMLLEFGLGHKMQSGAPRAFARIKKPLEWIGWMAILVGFVLVVYYSVIMVWCVDYTYYSFDRSWGNNPEKFFNDTYLPVKESDMLSFGSINWVGVIILFFLWVWIVLSIWKGARTVSKVVYVTAIVPFVILIIFIIRAVTLPGAGEGLKFLLTPDFSQVLNPQLWIAAYGQIFFSLSLGFGIMIAYASFLPRKSDIVNNSFIVCLGDTAFSLAGSIVVFSSLGYLAFKQGKPIEEVVQSGPGLVFKTYPAIINELPFAPNLFGVLFFVMLVFLAIDSAFSLVEAFCAGIMDKGFKCRSRINIICGALGFLGGIIFLTQAGFYWFDIVDHFNSEFALIFVGAIECVAVAYVLKSGKLREYVNSLSEFKIGKWWDFMIAIVAPLSLLGLGILTAYQTATQVYGNYPRKAVLFGGWSILIALPIVAFLLTMIKERNTDAGASSEQHPPDGCQPNTEERRNV